MNHWMHDIGNDSLNGNGRKQFGETGFVIGATSTTASDPAEQFLKRDSERYQLNNVGGNVLIQSTIECSIADVRC
jgi:hypothetical protein